ncbi:hypothetical protein D3C81_1381220 [compost metagenome]
MDIVAHAGTVRRGIVAAKYHQFLAAPASHLRHVWHQIIRNSARIFADQPAFMRADRIEIAQVGNAPCGVRFFQVAQDLLAHQLGLAIRIGRRQREILKDRHSLGIAINRRRGAEHQLSHPGRTHGGADRQQAVEVVAVILQRLAHGFAHCLERGKMDHAADAVFGKKPVQQGAVAHVAVDKMRGLAGNGGQPLDHHRAAVAQIIQSDHVVAGIEQRDPGM